MAKSDNEWVDVETAEVETDKVEWIVPVKEMVVEGELMRAFLVKQDDGKVTASYQIQKDDGVRVNLGERFFFKEAIRGINLGCKVKITFLEEKTLPKSRTQWVGKFRYKPGKGQNVYSVLKADYDKRYSEDASDNIPF